MVTIRNVIMTHDMENNPDLTLMALRPRGRVASCPAFAPVKPQKPKTRTPSHLYAPQSTHHGGGKRKTLTA
jgi:hypothetical protein